MSTALTSEITLPDGSTAEVPKNVTVLDLDFGRFVVHAHEARNGTIEWWRDKAVFAAIRDVAAEGHAEIENAFWQIYISKFIDDAFGASLDLIGRIVQEARNGKADPSYRVRLKARIAINISQGLLNDILGVIAILDESPVVFTLTPPASFVISFLEPPSGFATASEIAALIGETCAAGVGGLVVMPTAEDGFVLGDVVSGTGTIFGDVVDPDTTPYPAVPDVRFS